MTSSLHMQIEGYLKSSANISQAAGWLRDIQLGTLKVLLEIDRVCNAHKLHYFAIGGTLLGAVRHGGFIPWDDDIDIALPREEYERFVSIFNSSCKIPSLKARKTSASNGIWNLTKVEHQEIPSVFVDVFPVDFRYKAMTLQEKAEFTKELRQLLLEQIESKSWPSTEAYHQYLLQVRNERISDLTPRADIKPVVFWGLEFYHDTKFSAFDFDTVFPLRRIKFEGRFINAVHDPDLFLTYCLGNYMCLPEILHFHTDLSKIPFEEVLRLKTFLKKGV